MGGVWERMIGVTRRILDSMLSDVSSQNLTHEVLTTVMAEVSAIINSRPITTISTDPDNPTILSPSMLLTHKTADNGIQDISEFCVKDMYKAQWRRVQHLSNIFWQRWKTEYLQQLQSNYLLKPHNSSTVRSILRP